MTLLCFRPGQAVQCFIHSVVSAGHSIDQVYRPYIPDGKYTLQLTGNRFVPVYIHLKTNGSKRVGSNIRPNICDNSHDPTLSNYARPQ